MKKIIFGILVFMFACTMLDNYLVSDENNTSDETTTIIEKEGLLTVSQIKSIIVDELKERSNTNPIIKDKDYLMQANWGPIVLVQNKLNLPGFKFDYNEYYYVVHAIMPDNSVVAKLAIRAKSGKDAGGGLVKYNDEIKVKLMTQEQTKRFMIENHNLSDTINYKCSAEFYGGGYGDGGWGYSFERADKQMIKSSTGKEVQKILVCPYTLSNPNNPPNKSNGLLGSWIASRSMGITEPNAQAKAVGQPFSIVIFDEN